MDDKTQKERLEQELRFLKESFDAEVISREEYAKGKDRIEKKLREIEKGVQQNDESLAEEAINAGHAEGQKKAEETEHEPLAESKDGKIKLRVIQDDREQEYFENSQSSEKEETAIETKPEKPEEAKQGKDGKFFKYAVVFVVLVLVAFFAYSLLKNSAQKSHEKINQAEFAPACSSNDDCKQEGKEGTCIKPGNKDAKCEFKDIQKANVIVLNDRANCFNCDTQRVLSILEEWLGPLNEKEINFNTEEGKKINYKLDAKILPIYLFDENITTKPRFEKFRQAFAKNGDNYVMKDDAAGSTFYVKREGIPNKLDLFMVSGDDAGTKAENNLKEFLGVFKNIKFERHFQNDNLTKELEIKSFPAFLVNNRVRFSGVLAAETIKENFCRMNKLPECEKSLSKSLI